MSLPDAAGKDASDCPREANGDDRRFPRSCRLTSRKQYQDVYRRGRRVGSPAMTLFGAPNSLDYTRIGLTVTRKLGGAVARNRIKRRLREVFRRNRAGLATGIDLVVNARPGIERYDYAALEKEFLRKFDLLARRCGRTR